MPEADRLTRWDIFNALCRHVRAGIFNDSSPNPGESEPWAQLIEASSHHYVTPALARSLAHRPDVPADVRGYLDAVLTLNAQRNETLALALERIGRALNAIGIAPVLLKGAAHLADALYPAPGLRILGDIDLLLPDERARDIVNAMQSAGFLEEKSHGMPDPDDYVLGYFVDPGTGARIDLHRRIIPPEWEAIVAPAGFNQRCRTLTFRGFEARLPSATDMIAHTIVHGQLSHQNFERNNVDLRQLADLALLQMRHVSAIDWDDLENRFQRAGHATVLSTNLFFAETLLQRSFPKFRNGPRPGALDLLRETIEHPAGQRKVVVDQWLTGYLARLRARPAEIFNLLHPMLVVPRIRMLRQIFSKKKW